MTDKTNKSAHDLSSEIDMTLKTVRGYINLLGIASESPDNFRQLDDDSLCWLSIHMMKQLDTMNEPLTQLRIRASQGEHTQ